MIGVLPTGYGKSLIFQLIPDLISFNIRLADVVITTIFIMSSVSVHEIYKYIKCIKGTRLLSLFVH